MSRTGFGKTYATVQKMLTLLLKISLECLSLSVNVDSGTENEMKLYFISFGTIYNNFLFKLLSWDLKHKDKNLFLGRSNLSLKLLFSLLKDIA